MERRHKVKGAHDRHRNGNQGNERGPPVLQKDKNHDRHQNDRIAERFEHLRF